jgi:hypothetical protein
LERVTFCVKCGRDYAWRLASCPRCDQPEETDVIPVGLRTWFAELMGESLLNPDGTSRQEVIASCSPGDRVVFEHDPRDRRDRNAVRVLHTRTRAQIGLLPPAQALEYIAHDEPGHVHLAAITCLTGGTPEKPTRGATIFALCAESRPSMDDVEAFFA